MLTLGQLPREEPVLFQQDGGVLALRQVQRDAHLARPAGQLPALSFRTCRTYRGRGHELKGCHQLHALRGKGIEQGRRDCFGGACRPLPGSRSLPVFSASGRVLRCHPVGVRVSHPKAAGSQFQRRHLGPPSTSVRDCSPTRYPSGEAPATVSRPRFRRPVRLGSGPVVSRHVSANVPLLGVRAVVCRQVSANVRLVGRSGRSGGLGGVFRWGVSRP